MAVSKHVSALQECGLLFWLLGSNIDEVGWPQCGEIDIMEYRGQEPTKVLGTVHGPGYSGASITKKYSLLNDRFDTGFHVFGEGPKYINYYIDDVLYNQITPADARRMGFDHPFYIVINLAVGSFVGALINSFSSNDVGRLCKSV
jgi:beta-glucanase (GH16 family)